MNQLIGTTGNVAISDSYQWVAGGLSKEALPATPTVLGIGLLALGLGRRLTI